MYEYLKGIITKITAKYIVLETNGIGYILHVANPYAYSGQVNQEAQIYVHQVVREDAHLLYGFRSEDEKKALSQSDFGIWDWSCISSGYYRCR